MTNQHQTLVRLQTYSLDLRFYKLGISWAPGSTVNLESRDLVSVFCQRVSLAPSWIDRIQKRRRLIARALAEDTGYNPDAELLP